MFIISIWWATFPKACQVTAADCQSILWCIHVPRHGCGSNMVPHIATKHEGELGKIARSLPTTIRCIATRQMVTRMRLVLVMTTTGAERYEWHGRYSEGVTRIGHVTRPIAQACAGRPTSDGGAFCHNQSQWTSCVQRRETAWRHPHTRTTRSSTCRPFQTTVLHEKIVAGKQAGDSHRRPAVIHTIRTVFDYETDQGKG